MYVIIPVYNRVNFKSQKGYNNDSGITDLQNTPDEDYVILFSIKK